VILLDHGADKTLRNVRQSSHSWHLRASLVSGIKQPLIDHNASFSLHELSHQNQGKTPEKRAYDHATRRLIRHHGTPIHPPIRQIRAYQTKPKNLTSISRC